MSVARNLIEPGSLLAARVRIPQGVVYRGFVKETVILNIESGRYHGVNPSGGRMLETLEKLGSVQHAAEALARDCRRPLPEVQADLCKFCDALLARGLLEIEPA